MQKSLELSIKRCKNAPFSFPIISSVQQGENPALDNHQGTTLDTPRSKERGGTCDTDRRGAALPPAPLSLLLYYSLSVPLLFYGTISQDG